MRMLLLLLFYFCGTFLFTLGSCAILETSHILQRQYPGDHEGISDADLALAHTHEVIVNIGKQLEGHHQYMLDKMKNLEDACKSPNKSSSQEAIEYQVSDGDFHDPRINYLVQEMKKKMTDIGNIFMDDLVQKLSNIHISTSTRVVEKFSPLTNNINELSSQITGLAMKKALVQVQNHFSSLVSSNIEELKDYLRTNLPSKPELTTATFNLLTVSNDLQQKVKVLKGCENSDLLKNILKNATKTAEDLAEIKGKFKNLSSGTSCPNTHEELLLTLKEMVQENTDSIITSVFTTQNIEPQFSNRFEELSNVLKKLITILPTDLSTQSSTTTSTEAPAPCIDSNFIGSGRSLDVCNAAVRFRKCHLEFLAFHCCRSCNDAGLISTIPPNYRDSRTVPVMEALKSLRPN